MQEQHITLAHGNGGRFMRELIQELFARHLASPDLDTDTDAASRCSPPTALPSNPWSFPAVTSARWRCTAPAMIWLWPVATPCTSP